ncbi:hypothetical protein FRC12_009105 [Ceratobasidium sp. 428]|nr:hypothetical protein FRC12_009105 [Ceratobasidium sp. 428]
MASRSPPRSSADIYANRPSKIPYPPFLTPSYLSDIAPAMASPVSVSSQRNSTLVHRGFYDLLSLVPSTPGVGVSNRGGDRFWNDPGGAYDDFVAGRRYEDMPQTPATPTRPARSPPQPPSSPPLSPPLTRSYGLDWAYNYYVGSPPKSPPVSPPRPAEEPRSPPKGRRRISKDMVSRPMGFVHLVHASDADQAEALLRRWGPDGVGKLGDPNWAHPIKSQIRARQQERAVGEVMHAMDPTPSTSSVNHPVLRVMNGVSTSTLTTTSAKSLPSPGAGTDKSYSRLGLVTPRVLATQLEVEESGGAGGGGSTEGRMGHDSREGSEVTVKARAVVPTPARGAAPAVSPGFGVGYTEGRPMQSGRSPTAQSLGGQQYQYPNQQSMAYSPPQAAMAYPNQRPTFPTPQAQQPAYYQAQQPMAYSPPKPRSPAKSQSPPKAQSPARSPPKSQSPARSPRNKSPAASPRDRSPAPPRTPPKQPRQERSPAQPMPIPNRVIGIGAAEDPLAMHAAQLMKGVNYPSPMPGAYLNPKEDDRDDG